MTFKDQTTIRITARGYGSADTAVRRAYPNSPILSIVKVAPRMFEATIIDRDTEKEVQS